MKNIYFTARLLSDAVISERSATAGGHRCLDYIPGASILGAAAEKLYRDDYAESFQLFHSGKVRFGNAYPLTDKGEPTLPMPLCWHLPKGFESDDITVAKNLIHAENSHFSEWDRAGIQQKQLRSGYFTPSGMKISPARRYRLKTAIDRNRQGMADEAQLFGYQSLASGSIWYFSISFDDDISEKTVEELSQTLSGRLRIGRSRSAEYGLFSVSRADESFSIETSMHGERLMLFCLSDLAMYESSTATPCLVPDWKITGIENAVFSKEKSYLRIRAYTPFNSKRKRFDIERQVISKGSVLVFEKQGGFTPGEIQQAHNRLQAGAGRYRQDGLGQILVNPSFLSGFNFTPFELPAFCINTVISSTQPPPLAGWLDARHSAKEKEAETVRLVDSWIRDLVKGQCPKNSQWGQLRTVALQSENLEQMKAKLNRLCSEGVSQKQWEKPVKIGDQKTTYTKFIMETVMSEDIQDTRTRLYLLGNRLPRLNNSASGGEK